MPQDPHDALCGCDPHFPHQLQPLPVENYDLPPRRVLALFIRCTRQDELLVGTEGHVRLAVVVRQVVEGFHRGLELAGVPDLREETQEFAIHRLAGSELLLRREIAEEGPVRLAVGRALNLPAPQTWKKGLESQDAGFRKVRFCGSLQGAEKRLKAMFVCPL